MKVQRQQHSPREHDQRAQKQFMFPRLASYNTTRVILSYLTPIELESAVALVNRWAYNFIKRSPHISYMYGRRDFRAATVALSGGQAALRTYDISGNSLRSSALDGFPSHLSKYSAIEGKDNRLFVVGGFDNETHRIVSFLYEIVNQNVAPLNTTHYARVSFSLVIANNKLFIVGGFNDGTLRLCESIDLKTGKLRSLPSLNMKRCSPILCQFNNNVIYAFGGTDGYSPLNTTERYVDGGQAWTSLPDFAHTASQLRLSGFALQISRNEILIFGGRGGRYRTPVMDSLVYNAEKRRVTGTVRMAAGEPCENVGLHMEHEKVYVLGNRVHVYNCRERKWQLTQ